MPASQTTVSSHTGLPKPLRHWAMFTLVLSIFMAVLDGTIINVALPSIAKELGVPGHQAVWIINAYQLAIISTLLPYSSLAERIGFRNVYLFGLITFSGMALVAALAQDLTTLIIARSLQGIGAGAIMSINAALVRHIYPANRLGQGIAIIAMVVAVSAASGPTVAAAVLAVASWHWLFAMNVPFGILATLLGFRFLPHVPLSQHPFDWLSAILTSALFVALISAISDIGHEGQLYPWLIKTLFTITMGYILYRRLWHHPAPLLPLDLLRITMFRLSITTSVLAFCAQMLTFVAMPFYLFDTLGKSAMETGLLITPWPFMIGVVAPVAGRLADRYPAGVLGVIGLSILCAGLLSLALLPPDPTHWQIVWRVALSGAGFAVFQSPNNRAIMTSAPVNRSGGASGMLGTARLLGQSLGAALAGVMLLNWPSDAANLSLYLASGLALVATFISFLRKTERT